MSTNNSTLGQFQRSWDARAAIGTQLGFSMPQIKSVANYDYSRMLAGSSPLSNQDAYAALESVKSHHPVTADPTANQGNFFTNIYHDAQSAVTGLFKLPQALYGLGKNLTGEFSYPFSHPSQAYDVVAGVNPGNNPQVAAELQRQHSTVNQLLNFIPGYSDISNMMSSSGRHYLGQHPLLDVLDLAGVGKFAQLGIDMATGASKLAESEAAATTAAQGIESSPSMITIPNLSDKQKELSWQNIALSRHPIREIAQRQVKTTALGKLADKSLGQYGLTGNRVMEMVRPYHVAQKIGLEQYNQVLSDLSVAAEGMTPTDIRQLYSLLTDYKPVDEVMADPTIPQIVKDGYQKYIYELDKWRQHSITQGRTVIARNPATNEEAYVPADAPITSILKQYDQRSTNYQASMQNLIDAHNNFNNIADQVTKPVYDNPIGMDQSGLSDKTTFSAFVTNFRQFMHAQDPRNMVYLESASKESLRGAAKRYQSLFSDTGPIAQLQHAITTNDPEAIRAAIGKARNATSSKYFQHLPNIQQFREQLNQYAKAATESRKPKYQIAVRSATKKATLQAQKLQKINTLIDKRWYDLTKDDYEQTIARIMVGKLTKSIKGMPFTDQQFSDITDLLNNGNLYPTGLRPFMDPKEWQKIRSSAISEYKLLRAKGAKVFHVPKVSESERVGYFHIGSDRKPGVDATHGRAINFSYTIQNPFLGLAKAWEQELERDMTDKYFEMSVMPRLTKEADWTRGIEAEWKLLRDTRGKEVAGRFDEYKSHMYEGEYTKFNPNEFFHKNSRHFAVTNETQYVISKTDLALLKNLNSQTHTALGRTWDGSLKVFRHAVLTVSPRFAAHIILGGGFLTALQTGPDVLRFVPEAFRMIWHDKWPDSVKLPKEKLPIAVSQGTGYEAGVADSFYNPSTFHQFLGGRTGARLLIESVGQRLQLDHVAAASQAWHGFLEHVSDFYRSLAYLYGKNKASLASPRLTEAELKDAQRYGLDPYQYQGVKLAGKVLSDNNARTPLERTVIRFVMPFAGWSKHILRYVFTLPIDHPLRTSILSHLAEQEYQNNQTGLPQYLFHMLFLGHPDVNGNVTAVDFRQWNPLRDIANYMTLGGFLSMLNPAAQGLLSAAGINSATGTPELYPLLTYNSFYGGSQVSNPSGNTALSMLGAFIPEYGVLDHFLRISNYTKSLARYDPAAYKQQLWSSMNFPWAPQTLNVNQDIARQEVDRLNYMKTQATYALKYNDPSYIKGISGLIPYQGWYFTPGQINNLISQTDQYNKETGQTTTAYDMLQLPYAPTIPLTITPPAILNPR